VQSRQEAQLHRGVSMLLDEQMSHFATFTSVDTRRLQPRCASTADVILYLAHKLSDSSLTLSSFQELGSWPLIR